MRARLNILAWGFATAAVIYAAVGPGMGVLYDNPLATVGFGLIGLGLCKEGRRRLATAKVAPSGSSGGRA